MQPIPSGPLPLSPSSLLFRAFLCCQAYERRQHAAASQLLELDQRFAQAVVQLLDVPGPEELDAELSHQQQLQRIQVSVAGSGRRGERADCDCDCGVAHP